MAEKALINDEFHAASRSKRLLNLILDVIFYCLLALATNTIIEFVGLKPLQDKINDRVYTFIVLFIVFALPEFLWQKTFGKFLTKTKVVMKDGTKPDFLHIFIRAISRFIPFEAVSFLINKYPIGWHDRTAGTLVVSDKYDQEDVKKIQEQEPRIGLVIGLIIGIFVLISLGSTIFVVALNNLKH